MAKTKTELARNKVNYHQPVLLDEVINYLKPEPGEKYIDGTLGGAGHAGALIARGARVLGIDRDQDAISYVSKNQKENIKKQKLIIRKGNFNEMQNIATQNNFEEVDGILLDLGISSNQIEKAERGFSFQNEGPLDMRMDQDLPVKASEIVNNFEERRLNEIFSTYAEEKLSWPIARAICSAREIKSVDSTHELAEIVNEVYRKHGQKTRQRRGSQGAAKINPATKIFQGLRIVINSELLNLEECLPQTTKILRKGGRLVIISYHSLEDKIVKRFFKENIALNILTAKPIGPHEVELRENPRSRSAKLRAAEKN